MINWLKFPRGHPAARLFYADVVEESFATLRSPRFFKCYRLLPLPQCLHTERNDFLATCQRPER